MRRLRGSLAAWFAAVLLVGCALPRDTSPRSLARQRGAALAGKPQSRNLTCESRSAADLLAAHGLPAGEAAVLARIPRSDNPDLGFVGDPDEASGGLPPRGYGVHAGPVAAALRDLGLDARAESGRDLAWLAQETRAGRPVIAWVTGSWEPSRVVPMTDAAGRTFRAVPGEHTVLVLDVGRETVLVLDPATGGLREAGREAFESAWRLFDGACVTATGPLPGHGTGR